MHWNPATSIAIKLYFNFSFESGNDQLERVARTDACYLKSSLQGYGFLLKVSFGNQDSYCLQRWVDFRMFWYV